MMKEKFINNILVFAASILVLILIIIQLGGNNFRQGTENYANIALEGQNFITVEDFNAGGGSLIILGAPRLPGEIRTSNLLSLNTESMLSRQSIRAIRESSSPRIIIADTRASEAMAYMLLVQKGVKDLYLIADSRKDMVLKYEFRPDAGNASK